MKTVKDLVPGEPAEIWRLADAYGRMAGTCEELGRGFRAIDVGVWRGRAASAFLARLEQHPKRFVSLADRYLTVAKALDTYASALAWTQRQAGEVIALERQPPKQAQPVGPALTVTQQAEAFGVITGAGQPEPEQVRVDQRALAHDNYRRGLALLDTVGAESAAAITNAAAPMPALPALPAVPPPPPAPVVVPAPPARTWFDPGTLRDDLQDWATAIKGIRKRLRWTDLDRLSPRLSQHVFEGHYRPGKQVTTGYHHREGGVDRSPLRVTEIVEGPDEHGVYVGRVHCPRTPRGAVKNSTFFPDSWSRGEVLEAVRAAYLDAMRNGGYDPGKRRFRGVYRGVEIEGHLKAGPVEPRLYDIVTAYPRRVRRRRQR